MLKKLLPIIALSSVLLLAGCTGKGGQGGGGEGSSEESSESSGGATKEWVKDLNPTTGKTYKIGFDFTAAYAYLDGGQLENYEYYHTTVTSRDQGADYILETASGGFYLKCATTNKYLNIYSKDSGAHISLYAENSASTVYIVNSTYHTLETKDEVFDHKYVIGNQKSRDTGSATKDSYWESNALAEFWVYE